MSTNENVSLSHMFLVRCEPFSFLYGFDRSQSFRAVHLDMCQRADQTYGMTTLLSQARLCVAVDL